MIFNSIHFLLFFSVFFALYWSAFKKTARLQNILILIGSYTFYAYAEWRFVFFLIGVSLLNFLLGIYIHKKGKFEKLLLHIGLLQGIGTLFFYKYLNFFFSSLNDLLGSLGVHSGFPLLNIIVPIGISFFTFRLMGYLLDIYNGKTKPTTDWIAFFAYVAYFPSLLSGPIDRAKGFIPQLEKKRFFDYGQAVEGIRQILWGLFKKVVIANNCGAFVDHVFQNHEAFPGSVLIVGAFLNLIQVYADFSGYSDMAIGIARLMGISGTKNFDFPLFSKNIAEFWRKWHISLTSWFTEYVFTPLTIKFRDYDKIGLALAIIINFLIVGIWHGANWTYLVFGLINGCYFIPLVLSGALNKRSKQMPYKLFPTFKETLSMCITFILAMLSFVFFKATDLRNGFEYLGHLFSGSVFTLPRGIDFVKLAIHPKIFFPLFVVFILIEWLNRTREYGIENFKQIRFRPARWLAYYVIIIAIIYFEGKDQQFIYFKF